MKPVKELYYEAMKKCDEDKPGMALELGMNIFADGNPILSDLVRQLLISAYTRCDRDLFAEILDAHLKVNSPTKSLFNVGQILKSQVFNVTKLFFDKQSNKWIICNWLK